MARRRGRPGLNADVAFRVYWRMLELRAEGLSENAACGRMKDEPGLALSRNAIRHRCAEVRRAVGPVTLEDREAAWRAQRTLRALPETLARFRRTLRAVHGFFGQPHGFFGQLSRR